MSPEDEARLRRLVQRLRTWQDDDNQGYSEAIELLCRAANELEAVIARTANEDDEENLMRQREP